jgi:hypothetical protein
VNVPIIAANTAAFRKTRSRSSAITSSTSLLASMAEETTAKTSLSPVTTANAHKGPNLSGLDPESGALVRLFNPRQDWWDEHFERNGVLIVGSQCGWPSDGWLVEDERRRSASASDTVAFLRGKDTEDPNSLFRFSFWRCTSDVITF